LGDYRGSEEQSREDDLVAAKLASRISGETDSYLDGNYRECSKNEAIANS
jgi:hypothetical protein